MTRHAALTNFFLLLFAVFPTSPAVAQTPLEKQAAESLARATAYLRKEVAAGSPGAYLWAYSDDLKQRRGEGNNTDVPATQGWVQPPGTPSVGMAFLQAYEATGETVYLDAAKEAAFALARTQLESGGWDYRIEFDPAGRRNFHYRNDKGKVKPAKNARNITVFDDNTTQSALRFLMRVDVALKSSDAEIREAVEYALKKLLEAQYPNGAWPQGYRGIPATAAEFPVRSARYPETWSRTYVKTEYYWNYTLNDNALRDILLTLLEAHRLYGKPEHLAAAQRGGDFILLAQMPNPQPAWSQQYNKAMEPAWARKFEPPSLVTRESADAIRTLLDLYLYTGDEKYRQSLAPAIAWLRRSQLPNGKWARFYELQTNRPLYLNRNYALVYTDDDMPTHYAFQAEFGIGAVIAYYETVQKLGRETYLAEAKRRRAASDRRAAETLEPRIREILAAQDSKGRWLSTGVVAGKSGQILDMATVITNLELLAEYLAAKRNKTLLGVGGVSSRNPDREYPRRLW